MDKKIQERFEPIVTAFNMYKDSIKDLKPYEVKDDEQSLEEAWSGFLLEEMQTKLGAMVELKEINYWEIYNIVKEALEYVSKETGVEFSDNEKHVMMTLAFRFYVKLQFDVEGTIIAAKERLEMLKKQMGVSSGNQKEQIELEIRNVKEVIKRLTPNKEN